MATAKTGADEMEWGQQHRQEHEAFPFGVVGAKKEESQIYLSLLQEREKEFYPPVHQGFLSAIAATATGNGNSGEAVRNTLCEWCFKVADHFHFDREVCSIAMEYFDRTVAHLQSSQREPPLSKRMIQLISVTSLYMAIKIHGESDDDVKDTTPRRRKLRIDAYVTISHGFFTVEAIAAMESKILEILNWNINPPTGYQFISSLLALCPPPCPTGTMRNIIDVARYLSELSVCSSYFSSRCRTSVAAYASVLCAMEAMPELPSHFREIFIKNASEATGLHQDDEAVQRACAKLKDLCPSIFGPNNAGVHNVMFFDNANGDDAAAARVVSPVSVVEDDEAYDNRRAGKWETSPPMPPPPEHQSDEGLGDLPIDSGRKRSRSSSDGDGDKATHKEFHRRVSL